MAVPSVKLARVPVTFPVPPTAGVVIVNAGPVFWVKLTKVVFVGTASVRLTVAALEGPLLVTLMV